MAKEEFSAAEKATMKARSQELKSKTKDGPETQVLNVINDMGRNDKKLALKIHELVKKHAP